MVGWNLRDLAGEGGLISAGQVILKNDGPAFRPGTRLPTFDNVSVYPLLMRLLGLKSLPNDGDPKDTAAALR